MSKYKTPKFEIGDRVAYSVQFLKSIGMSHSVMGLAKGIVSGLTPFSNGFLVSITWTKADLPEKVLDANLAKVGSNPRFCNVD